MGLSCLGGRSVFNLYLNFCKAVLNFMFEIFIMLNERDESGCLVWFGLVWFGLVYLNHPFSHTCNVKHVNYRLQFIYYNTTYDILTSTQYNIINKNAKFKDQL